MKKLLVVVGTRPEAIKMIPVYLTLKHSGNFDVRLCLTGQHKSMVEHIVAFFGIQPEIVMDVMTPGQTLASLTTILVSEMTNVLNRENPDMLLVQGDTTSAFASALAAFYLGIKIGHVEAGLRTFDLQAPFPEEANRKFISCIADRHFAPTERNVRNLLDENISSERILKTGNTVIDALKVAIDRIESDGELKAELTDTIDQGGYRLTDRKFALITGHRRESFGKGFAEICKAIKRLAEENPQRDFVYPVHLNPNVRNVVFEHLGDISNVYLIPPMDYGAFVLLMSKCEFVVTDSGGVQEEAPSLRKPVFVMRETTERQEGVDGGLVKLVGVNSADIHRIVSESIGKEFGDFKLGSANPYGDGKAAFHITEALARFWEEGENS